MSKRRHWPIGVALIPPIAGVLLFVAWPSFEALKMSHDISSMVRSAESVRLESTSIYPPVSVELSRDELARLLEAMPGCLDFGLPHGLEPALDHFGIGRACHVKHRHEIVLVDSNGRAYAVFLNFDSGLMAIDPTDHWQPIPYIWRSGLRQLFTKHKLPVD